MNIACIKAPRPAHPRWHLKESLIITVLTCVIQILFAVSPHRIFADNGNAGTLIHCEGFIERLAPSGNGGQPIKSGDIIRQGDIIKTGPNGSAAILCADESLIRLNADTILVFERVAETAAWLSTARNVERSSSYRLNAGEIWLRNKNEHMVITLQTIPLTATLRGTELDLLVLSEDRIVMTVHEGLVVASNRYGTMNVAERETVTAFSGKPIEKQLVMPPANSVQWTLSLPYLPGFLDMPLSNSDPSSLQAEAAKVQNALSKNPSDMPQVLKLANLYSDAGLLTEGESLFKDILSQTTEGPVRAQAITGLAWINIRRNNPEDALTLLLSDATPGPLNLLERVVCYGKTGKTDQAIETLENGNALYPDFIPFTVQKARLFIALRKFDEARRLLNQVLALKPDDSRAWSLLGVIELIQGKNKEATAAAGKGAASVPTKPFRF